MVRVRASLVLATAAPRLQNSGQPFPPSSKAFEFLAFVRTFSRLPKAIAQFRVTGPKFLKNNHVLGIQHLLWLWHAMCISSFRQQEAP